MKKVVVTGLGAVTAIGATIPDFWDNLVNGKCGMKKITRISVEEHDTTVAAEVDEAYQTDSRSIGFTVYSIGTKDE